jgi:hypothetical protein
MNTSQTKAGEQSLKLSETVKQAGEAQGHRPDAARTTGQRAADALQQAKHTTETTFTEGVEALSQQAREAGALMSRTLGFSGEEGERLTQQSKQNMEAVTRGGMILTQAFQDMSHSWFKLVQNQWQRNLDGMNRLTSGKSVHDFTTIQGELVREGLQHMIQDSRAIAETSLRAVDDAGKTFAATLPNNPTPAHAAA